ncbi:MAG: transketolase family protein, partial [Halothermotrichaceae bacterium]
YVAYPNLNVKFIGANGGIGGGEREGVTHQFFEDLGIMRSLPSMTVLSPADGPEVYKATMSLHQYEGPAYLRVGNGREPKLFNDEINFELGKIRIIKNIGKDVVLFSTGPILKRTIKAAELLKKEGIKATVVEVPTLKPLDKDEITNVLEETGAVVTIEDHNIIGGLGSAIAEAGAGHITVPMERIGLQDVFPESGETEELLDKYKMGVSDIVNSAKKVYNKTNQ